MMNRIKILFSSVAVLSLIGMQSLFAQPIPRTATGHLIQILFATGGHLQVHQYFMVDDKMYDADYFTNHYVMCLKQSNDSLLKEKFRVAWKGSLQSLRMSHMDSCCKEVAIGNEFLDKYFRYNFLRFDFDFFLVPECNRTVPMVLDFALERPSGILPVSYRPESLKVVEMPAKVKELLILNKDSIENTIKKYIIEYRDFKPIDYEDFFRDYEKH